MRLFAGLLAVLLLLPAASAADGRRVTFRVEGAEIAHEMSDLLARSDATSITVPAGPDYGGAPMTYRAVPLLELLKESGLALDAPIQVDTADGFVVHFPAGFFLDKGPPAAEPFLAVEPPGAPWPKLKGKSFSAGPFYLVWLRPEASGVGTEQWPYQVTGFKGARDPLARWPQMDVARELPADHPARAGLAVFLKNCFPCHKMNGGGESTIGPDLNLPMNPTEYFQDAALRKYIRDPAAVRTWPESRMAGFAPDALPEPELDSLLAYLAAMRARRP